MKTLTIISLIAVVAATAATITVLSGAFNVAADVPHSALVSQIMGRVRDRSIAVRARNLEAPGLDDPVLIAAGAEHYAAMCIDCHLAPGVEESELRQGLYPKPPDLTQHIHGTPARSFWVIKHGIKMSAMPAWGITHDDKNIWALVAFLHKLPALTPDQYQALSSPTKPASQAPDRHDHNGGGEHHHE